MTEIPQWAKERARVLINIERAKSNWPALIYSDQIIEDTRGIALARYIAEHETPPVDPLLLEAREIVASWYDRNPHKSYEGKPESFRDGSKDNYAEVTQAIAALRRGLELAAVQEPVSVDDAEVTAALREADWRNISVNVIPSALRNAGYIITAKVGS